jgi:short-subunit dehydrogenase
VMTFIKNGFDVITCSRNAEDLNKLSDEINLKEYSGDLHTFKSDLSKRKRLIILFNLLG